MKARHAITCAIVVAFVASACGGGNGEPAAGSNPTPTTTAERSSVEAGAPTPRTPALDARLVSAVLSSDPATGGWLLPAGTWMAPGLDPIIEFSTDRDLIVERAGIGGVWLRSPDDDVGRTWVVVGTTAFINTGEAGSPEAPAPADADGITAEIERNEISQLMDMGEIDAREGPAPWWEWRHVEPAVTTSVACLSGRCIYPATTTGGEPIPSVIAAPVRVYVPTLRDARVGVWVTGDPAGYDQLIEPAEAIAASARTLDLAPPAGRLRWFPGAGLQTGSIDAGRYRAIVGQTLVDLVLTERTTSAGVDLVDQTLLGFQTASGYFAFADPRSVWGGLDDDARAVVSLTSARPPEVEAWLTSIVDVTASSDLELAGVSGRRFDVAIDGTAPDICPGECSGVVVTTTGVWFQLASWQNTIVALPDAGLLAHIEARPGSTIEDVLDEMAPVLDGLTLTPVG